MAVVVGFIPTEVGFKALAAAREEAEQRGGPLVVVNVLRAGVEEDPRHADEQQLEIARDELRRTTVRVAFRQETTEDDIADVLLQVVEEERAELLVLGIRRGRDLGAYEVAGTYHVGELHWWVRLWIVLSRHPVLVSMLGILAGLTLALWIYTYLRNTAARRLESQ